MVGPGSGRASRAGTGSASPSGDSNPGPHAYKASALPTELLGQGDACSIRTTLGLQRRGPGPPECRRPPNGPSRRRHASRCALPWVTMPGSVGPATLRKLQRLLAVLVVGAGVTVGSVGAVIFGLGRSELLGGIIATDVAAAIALGIVLPRRRVRRTRWDAMVTAIGGTVRGGPPAGLHDQAQLIRQSLAAGGVALLLAPLDQPLEIAAVSGAVPNGLRPGGHLPDRLTASEARRHDPPAGGSLRRATRSTSPART